MTPDDPGRVAPKPGATIVLVVPVYNEDQGLCALRDRIVAVMDRIPYDWSCILVDDGSRDASWSVIESFVAADARFKGIMFSRNFGKEMALTAGVEAALGADAVICLDADLQHPPEIIPQLIAKWEEGYDIVATIREKVADYSLVKKIGSKTFYWFMCRFTDLDLPPNSTDFRLLDRKVMETLSKFTEGSRMFRGIIDWMGFKKTYIAFCAPARSQGKPAYPVKKLFNLAINSFTSFSLVPLRLAGYLGLIIMAVTLPLLCGMVLGNWFLAANITPIAFFTVFNTLLIGIVLCALGMMSLYIGHIHTEVANRPLYIIRSRAGAWDAPPVTAAPPRP
ncbi:glycosyl transferase family 2 [Solidesulfovibrio carbinoliphilus subsp. oakridgensis]|uniref:Glycosyl transferase family 2 n=1 Tax=Solidesulfovibrio carbinoliphilus subsp. oakridgensis TaxID=694327 RepID=G7Q740_9BACT|nr:glycosyltransferase family 2 protein [Solidesulfovibrio carbinoliphilus]EHJ48997.1 glycosyl transferase family 2 [Solidesulfovibrio carbinoliphilus subsp. oakridgensis]